MNKKILLVGLLLLFLLRVPSFFEPYWYGDEGIYLAVGQALQRGAVLYRDIWDNKPPLLYLIYALMPTLFWAKLTATACVLGTVAVVNKFTGKLLPALLVGILLSLPYPILEGTIANAELYFILPIVIAAYFLFRHSGRVQNLLIGICFTFAFLLKIPAIFDFFGMFLAWFIINRKIKPFFIIALIPLITLISLIGYFYLNHALADFITAAFMQNSSYVAIDSGPFSKLSNPLFVRAFLLLLSLLLLLFLFIKKRISKELLFLFFWFGFSLYGVLLSSRPYPHYLLQVVPPAVILAFYLLTNFRKYLILNLLFIIILLAVARQFSGSFVNPLPYYQNFMDYISERKTWEDYVNFFDSRTSNNYDVAQYIIHNTNPTDPTFVWGDNAFVYVLANRPPATKFIQAHHLTTIDPENYDLIIQRLQKYQPKFIVVSRPVKFPFPKLEEFVQKNYRFTEKFEDLFVYQNTLPANPPKFDINYH